MSTEENEKKLDIEEQKTPINNPEEKTEEEEKEVTLTPSMLDSEGDEEVQVKRDLSAIIPQGITQPAMSSTELLQLNSKDKDLDCLLICNSSNLQLLLCFHLQLNELL